MQEMEKVFSWTKIAFVLLAVLALASPVLAMEAAEAPGAQAEIGGTNVLTGTPIGVGLIILGAGYGIGKIGSAAVESMARQPEVATNIQTGMIISAALIEGATFFALIVCIITAAELARRGLLPCAVNRSVSGVLIPLVWILCSAVGSRLGAATPSSEVASPSEMQMDVAPHESGAAAGDHASGHAVDPTAPIRCRSIRTWRS